MDLHVSATIPGGPLHTVGDITYELPSYFDVVATGIPRLDYEVHVGVQMHQGGPRAASVELVQLRDDRGRPTGPYVTSTALRHLALDDLLERAVKAAVTVAVKVEIDEKTGRTGVLRSPTVEERDDFYAAWRSGKRGGRRGADDETYRRVAEVYRQAIVLGDPPTQTVADVLGVARATAGRWVQEARERKYLRPAPGPRMAGEVPEEEDQ